MLVVTGIVASMFTKELSVRIFIFVYVLTFLSIFLKQVVVISCSTTAADVLLWNGDGGGHVKLVGLKRCMY